MTEKQALLVGYLMKESTEELKFFNPGGEHVYFVQMKDGVAFNVARRGLMGFYLWMKNRDDKAEYERRKKEYQKKIEQGGNLPWYRPYPFLGWRAQ